MTANVLPCRTGQRLWWVGAGLGLVLAAGTALAADADGDGLEDALEIQLMNRFAPVVRLHPDDIYRPANVGWYLARVTMRFDHAACGDCEILAPYAVTLGGLISKQHEEKTILVCSHNDTIQYSWNTTPDPSDTSDFFLQIPNDGNEETTRRGDLSVAVCYAHVRQTPLHHPKMYDVQYWFFYAYNGKVVDAVDVTSHEGDWEHITVRVEPDGHTIHRILFAAHEESEHRWYDAGGSGVGYTLISGRPVVYSAKHSHASYPWAGTWDRPDNPVEDYTADGGPTWDCLDRIVNVGEGNAPSGGMEWIQYTGHWGEIGSDVAYTTGPYGPAFKDSWNANVVGLDNPIFHGWVFVAWWNLLPGVGTYDSPFQQFTDGAQAVPSGGTIWVWPGNYSAVGTYSKPMTWQAWVAGSVVIGN